MRPLHRPRSRPGPRPDAPARSGRRVAARRCALLGLALFAWAAGGEPGSGQLREGERIGYGQLARLQPHLPPELWAHREVFFHPGMQLEVGPAMADYSPPPLWQEATARHAGQTRIGPDGSLQNYRTGRPFPGPIDCKGDPQAGAKIIWNFSYRWEGAGHDGRFLYTYWDRGEKLPLYYQGRARWVKLSNRPEPHYRASGGDVFPGDRRKTAGGPVVEAPFDSKGLSFLTYRYKSSDGPLAEARDDETWIYMPSLRRVRRVSGAQRTDAVAGTDFTLDDLFSFDGVVPQYEWSCLGQRRVLAPMNTRQRGYPYEGPADFGPSGLSFANDRWELRDAWVVRMRPRNGDHPYAYKDLYLDQQTLTPMYSFAYDQRGELWKILAHTNRWSEDHSLTGDYYPGWEGVPRPRDLHGVCDVIYNVQTGTGNRIEYWDRRGTPMRSRGEIRRFVDVGRLSRGR